MRAARSDRNHIVNRSYSLFLFVLALAGCARTVYAATPSIPAADKPIPATLSFNLYRGYLIVAHGSAGSLKNLNFLLDTGTSTSILDSRVARKLHLPAKEPASVVTLEGRAQGAYATLPSLDLGPVRISDLSVITVDISFFSKLIPVSIDGIIGLDVVGRQPFVIDYSALILRFGDSPALAVSVPLRVERGLAMLEAEIDHSPVHLAFDTGAASLVIFDAPPSPSPGSKVDSTHLAEEMGHSNRNSTRLTTVTLGDQEFRRKPALLVSNPKQSQLDFDGLMSPPALGVSRVSIDLKGGVLAFSR